MNWMNLINILIHGQPYILLLEMLEIGKGTTTLYQPLHKIGLNFHLMITDLVDL